jgi:protoporphyrinogen oxidase
MYKFLILGAGPAGLSFANYLKQNGEESFLVLEKEGKAGGLCRSELVDGSPLDIGGGHFLDVRRPKTNIFLFQFMPESEWNYFTRNSKIQIDNIFIDHPIETNIWQLSIENQIQYLLSIAQAGSNLGSDKPAAFIDWIYWKLGKKIADDYMIPYNKKMFGESLNSLGTYWLDKLPNVSFEETLRSCLTCQSIGTQPGHAQFYYPKKYGYGELWLRMAASIDEHIIYNVSVKEIDFNNTAVFDNKTNSYAANYIITTIPWSDITTFRGMPADLQDSISQLKHSSIQIAYFSENIKHDAQWIYYPNPELPYHRILLRHNFCLNSNGYWTETNADRVSTNNENYAHFNEFAYPLNTIDKPRIMKRLLSWAKTKNIIGLGRWGEHQHYNSDTTVEYALNLAEKMLNS